MGEMVVGVVIVSGWFSIMGIFKLMGLTPKEVEQ